MTSAAILPDPLTGYASWLRLYIVAAMCCNTICEGRRA
jgi:hypothetical protein